MEDLRVRAAVPEDAAAIHALVCELAEENGEETSLRPEFVGDYLNSPGSAALVAEADGRVIGLLSYHVHLNLYHAGPTAVIEELVVSSGMRGAGVGHRLVAAAVEAARSAGCREISVSTMFENERAQRFYRRHGFCDDALLLEIHFDTLNAPDMDYPAGGDGPAGEDGPGPDSSADGAGGGIQ